MFLLREEPLAIRLAVTHCPTALWPHRDTRCTFGFSNTPEE